MLQQLTNLMTTRRLITCFATAYLESQPLHMPLNLSLEPEQCAPEKLDAVNLQTLSVEHHCCGRLMHLASAG